MTANETGAMYFRDSFSILTFPSGARSWEKLDEIFRPQSSKARLRFIIRTPVAERKFVKGQAPMAVLRTASDVRHQSLLPPQGSCAPSSAFEPADDTSPKTKPPAPLEPIAPLRPAQRVKTPPIDSYDQPYREEDSGHTVSNLPILQKPNNEVHRRTSLNNSPATPTLATGATDEHEADFVSLMKNPNGESAASLFKQCFNIDYSKLLPNASKSADFYLNFPPENTAEHDALVELLHQVRLRYYSGVSGI